MTRSPKNHPINLQIGQRLRQRRLLLGLSQTDLGERMGQLSFQQIQKYEKGTNALTAVRLVQAAEALGVPITYFFEDLIGGRAVTAVADSPTLTERDARLMHRLQKLPDEVRAAFERLVSTIQTDVEGTTSTEQDEAAAEPEAGLDARRHKRGAA
jgi:transcriptional regulator with XRE-family HTH domain